VDFRYDPARVIAVVEGALRGHPIPNVAASPMPNCICYDIAREHRDSFAYYAVRYWLTDLAVDDGTNSLVRERIIAALTRAEIPLAMPSQMLTIASDAARDEQRAAGEHARRHELLRRLELFHDLTAAEKDAVAQRLRYTPFARGEAMTEQGREAHYLYILASGSAEVVVKVGDAPPERVGELRGPDFFGEMGMMTGAPRSATVIAREPCECYRLDKEAFQSIVHDRKELAAQISTTLARRRSELDAKREGLTEDQKSRRMADRQVRLLSQIELFFGLTSSPSAGRN
jgi:CRP-like cAMP-binding protein